MEIDLAQLPSNIKRIGINKEYRLLNSDRFLKKITYETEIRPKIIIETKKNYEESYNFSEENFLSQKGDRRYPNDQRSDTMNPNNPEHKAALDNRANQLNPKHSAYHSSRKKK
jgi:hypothetical protein